MQKHFPETVLTHYSSLLDWSCFHGRLGTLSTSSLHTFRVRACRVMSFFYFGLIAFSLMTGKTCLASTSEDAWKKEVQQLREAWSKQDSRSLAMLEKSQHGSILSDHPLRLFADYWRLSARLASGTPPAGTDAEEFRRFIARNHDSRPAHQLRREWLQKLGKAGQWDVFSEQYVRHSGDEADLACYSWQERLNRKDGEVMTEARALWTSGRTAPESCDAVFRVLLDSQQVDTEQQWMRLRRLLEQGAIADARRMLRLSGLAIRVNERQLGQANADAGRFLAREVLDARQRASQELFLHAVQRYARRDAADAAAWFATRDKAFPEAGRLQTWAEVAHQAAQQHEPRATDWFARANGATLSEAQAEWRVRAALRERNWKSVEAAVVAMPASQRREGAWRYWLGRAFAEQDRRTEAMALWEDLSREFNFYGLLAAEESGRLALPPLKAIEPTSLEMDSIRALPALQRSLLLYQAGLTQEGLQEWRWAMRGLTDRQYIAASALAEAAGVPDRALNAADRTQAQHDFTRRFPLPITAQLMPAALGQSLDPAWVYGLIKQESAFMQGVRSSAGAIGLMQLMPATARWAAEKTGISHYHTAKLADPGINLALGTWYLRHVYDDLADPVLATAAYNAGPGRARRWRAETPLDGAIYAETIPFNETRDYVKRVMANTWYYAGRLGAPKTSFKAVVGTVPARGNVKVANINPTQERSK